MNKTFSTATIAIFVLIFSSAIVFPQNQFQLEISCDKTSYTTWDKGWISLALINSGVQTTVDIYIAYVNPLGYIYFCGDPLKSGWSRFADYQTPVPPESATDVTIPENFSLPFTQAIQLKFPIIYNEYPTWGKYDLYFAVFDSNSKNIVSNIAHTSFTWDDSPIRANWTNYTYRLGNSAIAIDGDTLWSGNSGGACSIDAISGETTFYSNPDGLIANMVNGIIVDNEHRKWFSISNNGMSVLDKGSWNHYNHTTAYKIQNNEVTSIAIDNLGRIWAGFSHGDLYSFDGNDWIRYYNKDSTKSIVKISPAPDGKIWFTTNEEGVWVFDNDNWVNYNKKNSGIINDYINTIAHDIDGKVWMGSYGFGISVFDGENWTNITYSADGLSSQNISIIAIDSEGKKWISTGDAGVFIYDNLNWTNLTKENSGLADNSVGKILIDTKGRHWFGLRQSISMFDGENWKNFSTMDNGLLDSDVNDIAIDSKGRKWIAQLYGLVEKDGSHWTSYTTQNSGIISDDVRKVVVDHNDKVWVGTWDSGLSVFDGENWVSYNAAIPGSGFTGMNVKGLSVAPDGKVWVGTYNEGLFSFDGENWTKFDTPVNDFIDISINSIAFDSSGRIFLGTSGEEKGGLFVYDGANWTNYNIDNSPIATNNIQTVAIDSTDRIWFGVRSSMKKMGGLYIFDDSDWIKYDENNSPIDDGRVITAITFNSKGKAYIAIYGQGLVVFDGKSWGTYKQYFSNILNNIIESITIDKDGKKWIGMSGLNNGGISVLDDSQTN
jgi:ligand-binding sensor domain-containing protein